MRQISFEQVSNVSAQGYVDSLSIRFAKVVDQFSDCPAIIFGHDEITSYKTLDDYSNQLARFLLEKGIKRRDRICIFLEKSIATYSLIIACIKLGIAYYTLDTGSPVDRLITILKRCPPQLIFANTCEPFTELGYEVTLCSNGTLDFCSDKSSDRLLKNFACPSDPAYIMFTSGSTGEPKGVVITHANLDKFINWSISEYEFTQEDRHTNINPIYFDNSIFDIFPTLFSGGALVPFSAKEVINPFNVVRKIEELQCTVLFSVPSMLIFLQTTKALSKGSLPSLRKIIFGGEGYPITRLKELRASLGQDVQLINVYGPTECTCICSSYIVNDEDLLAADGYPPIGSVTTYFDYFLLDNDLEVNQGDVGELCLGGPCVGHGYFGNADLTSRSFVQNPLNKDYIEIIYRTGDLMRLDPCDGKLKFVGRKDFQIKHQGYRIELEEIQHGLNRIPGIVDSVAIQVFIEGNSSIVGFVASTSGLTAVQVKLAAAKFLPKYMVPQVVHVLESLPKNANGKTDRKKLASLISN